MSLKKLNLRSLVLINLAKVINQYWVKIVFTTTIEIIKNKNVYEKVPKHLTYCYGALNIN